MTLIGSLQYNVSELDVKVIGFDIHILFYFHLSALETYSGV